MRIRFAPAVTGWRHTHQAGVQLVLDIAFQDAIFDQHVVLTRNALIIHRQRAAQPLQRAIIHHGAEFRSNQLPHLAAEYRRFTTVKIALKAMSYRFVQQHARPASAQHNRQRASWGCHCREVNQRHTHRFARPGVSPDVTALIGEEKFIAGTCAHRLPQPAPVHKRRSGWH